MNLRNQNALASLGRNTYDAFYEEIPVPFLPPMGGCALKLV